tara:strand:+ start:238 stop:537 length:300 start_codon:yes stop_codon:yes gene_type:complete
MFGFSNFSTISSVTLVNILPKNTLDSSIKFLTYSKSVAWSEVTELVVEESGTANPAAPTVVVDDDNGADAAALPAVVEMTGMDTEEAKLVTLSVLNLLL